MDTNIFNCEILEAILGTEFVDTKMLKDQIQKNSSVFLSELESYRIFGDDETQIIDYIESNYKKYSRIIIDRLSLYYFNMPIEMAIATKEQEKIKSLFLNAAERLGFDAGMQTLINSELEHIADKLNRRFTFDSSSLIHLIEASKCSNIQLEEDFQRRNAKNARQILKQKTDGTFYLADTANSKDTRIYTTGKNIPNMTYTKTIRNADGTLKEKEITITDVDRDSNLYLSSYPGAKAIMETNSSDEIMRQIMQNLFDNLELCVNTYKFFYTNENGIAVKNNAVLADDSEFEFFYKINPSNLPHLLGIQTGEILSQATKNFFTEIRNGSVYYPINENSSARDILKTLLKNKQRIIDNCGLIEENGKLYQLFPWEKIILKTSSFMRGDFFKTCFCLVELDRGINSSNEKFASISSTKYDENMTTTKFDARMILKDLINTAKQNKDFIFRTFVENYDRKGIFLGYVPQSIDTGKAENIVTNKGERIQTLNRFRNALSGNPDGGSVVQSIENENIGKRVFSPIEQALAHINISSGLNVGLQISEEAFKFEEYLKSQLGDELDKDLQRILTDISIKRKH